MCVFVEGKCGQSHRCSYPVLPAQAGSGVPFGARPAVSVIPRWGRVSGGQMARPMWFQMSSAGTVPENSVS